MYNEAVDDIHAHLIRKSLTSHLTYTAEIIPQRRPNQQTYVISPSSMNGKMKIDIGYNFPNKYMDVATKARPSSVFLGWLAHAWRNNDWSGGSDGLHTATVRGTNFARKTRLENRCRTHTDMYGDTQYRYVCVITIFDSRCMHLIHDNIVAFRLRLSISAYHRIT